MDKVVKGSKVIVRRPNGTKRVYTVNEEPSRTDQQYKDDCDVNFIMDRFFKTGQISHLARREGHALDVSDVTDLAGALQQVRAANELFMDLPAKVRDRFANDPVQFFDFVNDPKNGEEAVALGLAEIRKAPDVPIEDRVTGAISKGFEALRGKKSSKEPDGN